MRRVRLLTRTRPTHRRPGFAFVVSSPSGGGKTTVATQLLQTMPRLVRSVSVTTRRPRANEEPGRDYRFVSWATFQRMRRANQLLEWAKVHDAYYGTPKRPILQTLAQGTDVLLSIDVQGARQIRRALGPQAVLVFLLPPSMAQLRRRLIRRRTDSPAAIRRRLAAAKRELACVSWYDHAVINDQLKRTVKDLGTIITTWRETIKQRRPIDARRPAQAAK